MCDSGATNDWRKLSIKRAVGRLWVIHVFMLKLIIFVAQVLIFHEAIYS